MIGDKESFGKFFNSYDMKSDIKFMNIIIALFLLIASGANAQRHSAMGSNNTVKDTISPFLLTDFDYDKPVFKFRNEQLNNENRFLRYSALTGYREGVEPIIGQFNSNFKARIDKEKGIHHIVMYNLSIEQMLTHGLRNSSYILLEVNDPSKYRYDTAYGSKQEWMRNNTYCYELLLPAGVLKSMQIVDDGIARIFNVKYGTEKRMTKALVLIRTSDAEKFKATGGGEVADMTTSVYKNVGMGRIGDPLYVNSILPFVNETGYEGLIDVALNVHVKTKADIPALRKALQRYDLDIIEADRMIELFVITEIK